MAGLGAVARPGTTPYQDYLTAVHLRDLREADGKELDAHALAYVFTMREHRLLPEANLGIGTRVRARLVNYDEHAAILDPLNRGELDEANLMLETHNFAEWISPAAP